MKLVIWFSLYVVSFCQVLELDGNFSGAEDGAWLINFYAPWCGYCRRLSPIYQEVGKALQTIAPSIKVARIDASTFSAVGKKYSVNGFPTIKFIEGRKSYTYDGDRSFRSLLSFAVRSHGPAVKAFHTTEELLHNLTFFNSDPYFVLVDRPHSELTDVFFDTAERLRMFSWFLILPPTLLYPHLLESIPSDSDVILFKDGGNLFYPNTEGERSLPYWILHERHPSYPHFTATAVWEFGSSELSARAALSDLLPNDDVPSKILALVLVKDSSGTLDPTSTRLMEVGRSLARRRSEQVLSLFQFGWTDAHTLLEEWAITNIVTPNFVVFDWPRRLVYLYRDHDTEISDPDSESVISFLHAAREGKAKAYGGNGVISRLRRLSLKLSSEFVNFASHHPLITLVLCGLPAAFFSAIFYMCLCLDDHYADSPTVGAGALMNETIGGSHDSRLSTARKHSSRNFIETGPVESKDTVDARRSAYEEWKKNV